MSKTRVLLVDDHALMCEGLRALLAYYEDVEVVGDAADGQQAIAQVSLLKPDVVLMDVAMPVMNGIDATRAICTEHPGVRVLVVTQHTDRQYLVPLLRAGAAGYILKRALGSELISAIRTVAEGGVWLDPSISGAVVDELRSPGGESRPEMDLLTAREREVLEHVAEGLTNAQIAAKLMLSVKTVEWHRANLMSKLRVHSTAELVLAAVRLGLVGNRS
jgi:DNA-binding NarL/FixJ family response regulator